MTPAAYRAALPRLYDALVARHGRPSPIQLAAAAPLLAGRDALLCAPTASGKTEAYVVPLAERYLVGAGPSSPARVLLISPTRALANDLHRRLHDRLGAAGIPFGRWTGEHHDASRLQAVTVLTPESLDARLSRSPRLLDDVAAVVLDEIHVLDGTARGDQLRVLVQRVRVEGPGGAPRVVQVVAASATVPDPEALAARYLVDPAIVTAGDRRPIRARIVDEGELLEPDDGPAPGPLPEGEDDAPSPRLDPLAALLAEQVRAGFRKLLCFTNAREDVEKLATKLRGQPPFGAAVWAHHGSLARGRRLETERAFLRAPAALCVATSTLELGIDIGDVDLVVLYGVPPDIPALLQRVGRGGRRTGENAVLAIVRGRFQASALRTMLRAAAAGEFLALPYGFRPGVLVQQALSALHARPSRTIDASALNRRLPADLAAAWPPARIEPLLAAAAAAGWLGGPDANGRYGLGEKAEAAWARGALHANLAERRALTIHDAVTGDAVGTVATLDAGELGLGGQGRSLVHRDGERVVTASSGTAALPNFGALPGAPIGAALATAWLRDAGIPAPCRAVVNGTPFLFHGMGTAGGPLVAWALKKAGAKVIRTGRLAVAIEGEWPVAWPLPVAARKALGHRHRGVARSLGMGSFHALLPEAEQVAATAILAQVDSVAQLFAAGPPPVVAPTDEDLWWEAAHG